MSVERTAIWEGLLAHAFEILDAALDLSGLAAFEWTLGGGTVLMRRYRHRVSKDIDIFLRSPQLLGFFSPRLNAHIERMTSEYVEQSGFTKLYFDDGEIDFIAAGPVTATPAASEEIRGRLLMVETDAEIIAKKVAYRGSSFKARDLFDLACVIRNNPGGLAEAHDTLGGARESLLARLASHRDALQEDFEALDTLGVAASYAECVRLVDMYLANL